MTRNEEIARDLGVKLSAELERVLKRDLAVAQSVLPMSDIAMLLVKTAIGVNACAISAALQCRKPGLDPADTFDEFAGVIAAASAAHKPAVLEGLSLIESGRSDEAERRFGAGRRA
jgi:hypothetical protein